MRRTGITILLLMLSVAAGHGAYVYQINGSGTGTSTIDWANAVTWSNNQSGTTSNPNASLNDYFCGRDENLNLLPATQNGLPHLRAVSGTTFGGKTLRMSAPAFLSLRGITTEPGSFYTIPDLRLTSGTISQHAALGIATIGGKITLGAANSINNFNCNGGSRQLTFDARITGACAVLNLSMGAVANTTDTIRFTFSPNDFHVGTLNQGRGIFEINGGAIGYVSVFNSEGLIRVTSSFNKPLMTLNLNASTSILDVADYIRVGALNVLGVPVPRGVYTIGRLAFLYPGHFRGSGTVIVGNVPPVILDFKSPIISDDTPASNSNHFVYPDAINLDAHAVDPDLTVTAGNVLWSYLEFGGVIRLNNTTPLNIGTDNPSNPGTKTLGKPGIDDPDSVDSNPRTITFRNNTLSPIGGPDANPGASGPTVVSTRVMTIFASDGDPTTYTMKSFLVFTEDNGLDRLSGISKGALTAALLPVAAADQGAMWRRSGTTPWFRPGETEYNVLPGTTYIEFSTVSGWIAPPSKTVTVLANQTAVVNASYMHAAVNPALVWVEFGYYGEEFGSQAQPYNTLSEGIIAVQTGGTIRIKMGSTSTVARLSKPMRIDSFGGPAVIGR